ncbi:MAG: FAD:protein FMN transferase, partial [Rhizobium sp.]|nr:FAD:protein FMN transferase [Rhizobium sp.]
HAAADFDPRPVEVAMATAVAEVDSQMSTWKPNSDINRLSRAAPGEWVDLPPRLIQVLETGLSIGRASGGAFDIGMGDAVSAWGFGTEAADGERIREARQRARRPAHEVLELDRSQSRARKLEPMVFDLNGIAKGYGVDRLSETALAFGIKDALLAIDGELRALGAQPDGSLWAVAVEAPDPERRAAHSVLALSDAAVATSGDYRHWVQVGDRRLSHTMDPRRGMPLAASPASVTVLAERCMDADAWATAMMVLGAERGLPLARTLQLSVLFLDRNGQGIGTGHFCPAEQKIPA